MFNLIITSPSAQADCKPWNRTPTMLSFVLALLLLGVACSTGKVVPEKYATPKRCCLPDEWEGLMTQFAGVTFMKEGITQGGFAGAAVHIDAKTPRMRTSSEAFDDVTNKTIYTDVYANKTATYVTNPDQKVCHKVDVPLIINKCIPDFARHGGTRKYGDSKASVLTDDWVVSLWEPNVGGMARVSVTQNECFPITQLITGRSPEIVTMQYDEFFNLKEGIKDPSVFDLPAYCQGVKETTDHSVIEKVKARMKAGFSL